MERIIVSNEEMTIMVSRAVLRYLWKLRDI